MDGNHNLLLLQLPLPTESPAPVTNSTPPSPPSPRSADNSPVRHLSAPPQDSSSSSPSRVAATDSAQGYYTHSTLAPAEGPSFATTSPWSPQSANSSLSSQGYNAQLHHPARDQLQSQAQEEKEKESSSAGKRKRPSASASVDPSQRSSQSRTLSTPRQPPKKQRRPSKAVKSPNDPAPSETDQPQQETAGEMSSDRPRLTEQEKKSNHIASEQKRRLAIREGFDRLTEIVPGLEGQGRSESIVLKKSVDHMREVLQERQELIEQIQALGGEIPPELR